LNKPTLPELTDILRACQRGDRTAQRMLFEQYKNKMFGVCLRYADSREDAEDILQEGFVKVFRDLHQFRNVGSLEGWVRKVMVNTALQYVRKQRKLQPFADFDAVEYTLATEAEEPFDQDLVKKILHLMQQMPIGFRTVLNLYVMEGYTHPEIAEELGISVGTSKSQLARAKRHLRELVDRYLTKSI
jgi:RNA polymerase sigma factor (sigma-70 family)